MLYVIPKKFKSSAIGQVRLLLSKPLPVRIPTVRKTCKQLMSPIWSGPQGLWKNMVATHVYVNTWCNWVIKYSMHMHVYIYIYYKHKHTISYTYYRTTCIYEYIIYIYRTKQSSYNDVTMTKHNHSLIINESCLWPLPLTAGWHRWLSERMVTSQPFCKTRCILSEFHTH